uniref:Uncharacterized protein n=1 Tax=Opuntia streptacantha TaxID=393608 RepID=A0A7C9CYU4_OPUST
MMFWYHPLVSLRTRMLCAACTGFFTLVLCGCYVASFPSFWYIVFILLRVLLIVTIVAGSPSDFFGFYFQSRCFGYLPPLFSWVCPLFCLSCLMWKGWVIMSYSLVLGVASFWSEQPIHHDTKCSPPSLIGR